MDYLDEGEDGSETPASFQLSISRDPEEKQAAAQTSDQEETSGEDDEEEEITAYARVGEVQDSLPDHRRGVHHPYGRRPMTICGIWRCFPSTLRR